MPSGKRILRSIESAPPEHLAAFTRPQQTYQGQCYRRALNFIVDAGEIGAKLNAVTHRAYSHSEAASLMLSTNDFGPWTEAEFISAMSSRKLHERRHA